MREFYRVLPSGENEVVPPPNGFELAYVEPRGDWLSLTFRQIKPGHQEFITYFYNLQGTLMFGYHETYTQR